MNKFWQAWDQFWFGPQKLLNLAFMRVVLVGSLLHLYLARSANMDYFMANGFLQKNQALSLFPEFLRPSWQWFFWPDAWAPTMHGVYLLLLLLLLLGIGGRWITFIAWILHMGFLHRNYGAVFGADIIGGVFLFYLSFTQSCARLSVLNFFRRGKPLRSESDFLSSLMMRLMQFQICIVYAYTGFEKLRGQAWWDGTALWTVMANPQMVKYDWTFLRHTPWVIVIGSFVSVLFEIYFPAAMLHKKARKYWLLLGVFFHLSIGLSMGLIHFSLCMISSYFLFIPSEGLEKVLLKLQGRGEGLVSPSQNGIN